MNKPEAPVSSTLDCPNCQRTITYYDVAESSYYACRQCRTFFKYEYEGPPEILTTFSEAVPELLIPIGSEGYLDNQFGRVLGYIHKQEKGTSYRWVEYVIRQQGGQLIQLAEYNGHWMLIQPAGQAYDKTSTHQRYVLRDERKYKLYNQYQPEVIHAVGEFDWNILDDEKLTIAEYIDPPSMLISERNQKRVDWYVASYLSPSIVAEAFGMPKADLPDPYGVGAIEPADPKDRWGAVLRVSGMVLVLMVVLQIILAVLRPTKLLLNESFTTESDSTGSIKPIVSPSFEVDRQMALGFDLSASIDNQWLELPITTVDEQSGRVYEFSETLEYYHGVESGESWSEGSQEESAVLGRIPAGRYHLTIYPARDPGQSIEFHVNIWQNTRLISNAVLLLGLLTIYPILLYWRRSYYDKQRWNDSDYAEKED
jgi:hypothetical protein